MPQPQDGKFGWPWIDNRQSFEFDPNIEWPLLSIVTPSLNQGQFLEETIRSVLLQGYPNLEFMIMDGGSTDNSVDIIKKYSPWISYWVSERDQGQSDAINRGFSMAKGEFVAWLNSDDVFLPGCIRKILDTFRNIPTAGMVFGDVEVINENGNRIGKFEPVDYCFDDLLSFRQIIPQQAAFFRKEVAFSVGLLNTDLDYAMDHDFFIKIGYSFPIVRVSEIIAQFRLSQMNKGVLQRSKWAAEFVKILENFYQRADLPPKVLKIKQKAYGGAYYRGAASFLEDELYNDARQWFLRAIRVYPYYLIKPGWWKKMTKTFIGKKGNRCLKSLKILLRRLAIAQFDYDWQVGLGSENKNLGQEKL